MKVYYFGNSFLKEDSLAIKVCNKLKKHFQNINSNLEFQQIKDTFQLIDLDFKNSVIIDVAEGLKEISWLSQKNLVQGTISSLHDFDLSFFLKLTKKKVKILGIPKDYNEKKALKEVKDILNTLSSQQKSRIIST